MTSTAKRRLWLPSVIVVLMVVLPVCSALSWTTIATSGRGNYYPQTAWSAATPAAPRISPNAALTPKRKTLVSPYHDENLALLSSKRKRTATFLQAVNKNPNENSDTNKRKKSSSNSKSKQQQKPKKKKKDLNEQERKKRRNQNIGKSIKKLRAQASSKSSSASSQNQKQQQQQQQQRSKGKGKPQKGKEDKVEEEKKEDLLRLAIDPYAAGQKFRQSLGSALTSLGSSLSQTAKPKKAPSIYYLDDRFLEPYDEDEEEAEDEYEKLLEQRREEIGGEDYLPEVLVVGATGAVGRLVVHKLLNDGRYRVRVLVRDLYSKTLNLLGTGVTYCQGDLQDVESLEYALTDVDKIVFCAGSPRKDEDDFMEKFQLYVSENKLDDENNKNSGGAADGPANELLRVRSKKELEQQALWDSSSLGKEDDDELDFERLNTIMEVRSKLAEQIDCIGMSNLVRAYQNVRHADYGTSQAAKRSLFKFKDRAEDFGLFAVDVDDEEEVGEEDDENGSVALQSTRTETTNYGQSSAYNYDNYGDDDDEYADEYAKYNSDNFGYDDMEDGYAKYDESYGMDQRNGSNDKQDTKRSSPTSSGAITTRTQFSWIKNDFGHGVFVGRVPTKSSPTGIGGEAAIVSGRLRSSQKQNADSSEESSADSGIDLSNGFAEFVIRLCSDGGNYEMFVRTKEYETNGIEYIADFGTKTKSSSSHDTRRNKFVTVRLAFSDFQPQQKRKRGAPPTEEVDAAKIFCGQDVRQIGFRYRADKNEPSSFLPNTRNKYKIPRKNANDWSKFYLSLSYIKVYRAQPEPEFVYLSDARIPPTMRNGMILHDVRRIVSSADIAATFEDREGINEGGEAYQILDEAKARKIKEDKMDRSEEETYYKYRGEEILRHSGLSYTIVRVAGYNESPIMESTRIRLQKSDKNVVAVSRDDVAQVCADALLDPSSCNKCFYLTKAATPQDTGGLPLVDGSFS